MSTQGATLRRGTIELPIWPVAVLLVAAVAATIGMTLLRDAGRTTFVTSVTDSERLANSSAAVREQGAVAPAIPAIRPIDLTVLENSSAVVREQGATLPATVGISHVAPSLHSQGFAGFENPGAYVTEAPAFTPGLEYPGAYIREAPAYTPGLENPGAYPAEIGAPAEGPVIVNGQACGQCR
jgi:hypothetical protein